MSTLGLAQESRSLVQSSVAPHQGRGLSTMVQSVCVDRPQETDLSRGFDVAPLQAGVGAQHSDTPVEN